MNDACRGTPTLRQVATPGAIKLISLTSECYFFPIDITTSAKMDLWRVFALPQFVAL